MRILLVDVDSKIPNLALGKISSYYKSLNYSVDYVKLSINFYKPKPHKVDCSDQHTFASFIFDRSLEYVEFINPRQLTIGGPATNNHTLPSHIQTQPIDYSLWPNNKTSYGYITRGCIRNCYFCKVPKLEGNLHFAQHPKDIIQPDHTSASFLDNNFLAYENHLDILHWLVDNKIKYEFQQGLDIRLVTHANAQLLAKSKYKEDYKFAFDHPSFLPIIVKKLKILTQYISKPWDIKFYIYHNAANNTIDDTLSRLAFCKKYKILPYLMRDLNCYQSEHKNFLIDLATYCNQPFYFKHDPECYITKRTKKKLRQNTFLTYLKKYPDLL